MAGTGATPAAFYLGLCRLRGIQSPPASATASCRRAVLHRHDDCAASIRKSGPEIKNRCTQEGVNGEKLASILKSGPEIKNHCTLDGLNGGKLASALDRQWRQKRVLMRPEAAFPYVFAAEGAQHPPKKPPRSTVSRNGCRRNKPPRPTTLAAALPAAPAYAPQHKKRG